MYASTLLLTMGITIVEVFAPSSGGIAISSDGSTAYLVLSETARAGGKGSQVYALDVASARLRALTDGPGRVTWLDLGPWEKRIVFQRLAAESSYVAVLDLRKGVSVPVHASSRPVVNPRWVMGPPGLLLGREWVAKGAPWRWLLQAPGGGLMPIQVPESTTTGFGRSGISRRWLALPVLVPVDMDKEAEAPGRTRLLDLLEMKWRSTVRVVDLTALRRSRREAAAGLPSRCVARWPGKHGLGECRVDLAFDPAGKRLVAARREGFYPNGETVFFELDPEGEKEPARLFADARAFRPTWTPDGNGLVYLRGFGHDDDWWELVLWRPDLKQPQVLARFPEEFGHWVSTWRWLDDERLRVVHHCDADIYVFDTGPGEVERVGRYLRGDRVRVLKAAADLERAMAAVPDLSKPPSAGGWPEAYAPLVKQIAEAVGKSQEEARGLIERMRQKAAVWEKVPVVTPLEVNESGDAKPFWPPVLSE